MNGGWGLGRRRGGRAGQRSLPVQCRGVMADNEHECCSCGGHSTKGSCSSG